ncbi:MAG: porin family protein [Sphingomonas sp.]|nr:porin family protein [Sphingomonas sp.]
MRTILAGTALLAGVLAAAPAMAQNFNGPYVGVQGGWSEEIARNPRTDLGVVPLDATRDSATLGVFAGYDHQYSDKIVIGAEGSFNFNTKDNLRSSAAASDVTIDPKYSLDITARAGYLVTPKTLVYVRGGYANERFRTTIAQAAGSASAAQNRDGWLVGAGVERIIIPHVSGRVEYRYTDFSKDGGQFDRHQVLAGVAYRF